jgi:hypothetical protein
MPHAGTRWPQICIEGPGLVLEAAATVGEARASLEPAPSMMRVRRVTR